MYRAYFSELKETPFIFTHKLRDWAIQLGYEYEENKDEEKKGYYTLKVNGVEFLEMKEAPQRQRAALARTAITMKLDGPLK